jgi:hypothetical protein
VKGVLTLWRQTTHTLRCRVLDSIPERRSTYVGQLWGQSGWGVSLGFAFFCKSLHEKIKYCNLLPEFCRWQREFNSGAKRLTHAFSVKFCTPHTPRVITDCWQATQISETKKNIISKKCLNPQVHVYFTCDPNNFCKRKLINPLKTKRICFI